MYANVIRKTTYRNPDRNEIGLGSVHLSPVSGEGGSLVR